MSLKSNSLCISVVGLMLTLLAGCGGPQQELFAAIDAGDASAAAEALANGADPNGPSADGELPLGLAMMYGDMPAVTMLLKAGANPNARLPKNAVNAGMSLFEMALASPLPVADRSGGSIKPADFLFALIDAGADLSEPVFDDPGAGKPFGWITLLSSPQMPGRTISTERLNDLVRRLIAEDFWVGSNEMQLVRLSTWMEPGLKEQILSRPAAD